MGVPPMRVDVRAIARRRDADRVKQGETMWL
jgi:hypothetical protein